MAGPQPYSGFSERAFPMEAVSTDVIRAFLGDFRGDLGAAGGASRRGSWQPCAVAAC